MPFPALQYARPNTGLLSGAIGWFNFASLPTSFNVSAGAPFVTTLTNTIQGGGTLQATFTCSKTSGTANFQTGIPPTWSGAAFGITAYTGFTQRVYLRDLTSTFPNSGRVTVGNIILKDATGTTIPNYNVYFTDAESLDSIETETFTTDGSPWQLFFQPPPNSSFPAQASLTGVGTTIVNATNGNCAILTTANPRNLSMTLSGGGAFVFGLAFTTAEVRKVITSRINPADQFILAITGVNSGATITAGTTNGLQAQSVQVISPTAGSFIFEEAMAPGSTSQLSFYSQTVQVSNLSAGGTTVPSTVTLGQSIAATIGDYMLATIVNTPKPQVLSTTKSANKDFASVGETIIYTVTLSNPGPQTATNVFFKDTIPASTEYVANSSSIGGSIVGTSPAPPSGISIGSLSPNATTTITFAVNVVSIPTGNRVLNSSFSTYDPIVGLGISSSNTVATTIAFAQLNSTKAVNKNFSTVGDILIYTITIPNTGNVTASNLLFFDTIPSGTSFVTGSFTQDGTLISTPPSSSGISLPNSVRAGGITTISFRVRVDQIPSPNPIENSASVQYNYTKNPALPNAELGSTNTNIVQTQINTANLGGVLKSVDKDFAAVGDILTYTITIPNVGNTTANNVVMVDTIPSGTVFVQNSVFVNGVQTSADLRPPNSLLIASIPAASLTTVTFQVMVNSTIPTINPIPNRSTIGYNYIIDPVNGVSMANGGNNTNIVSTTIISPVISPIKSVNQPSGYVGDPITYTVVLQNRGNATATNVVFVDTIPSGTTFINDSLAIDGVSIPNQSPEPPNGITLPDIGLNSVVTITFDAFVDTIPNPNPLANQGTAGYNFIQNPSTGETSRKVANTNIVTTFIYPITNPFKAVDQQFATMGDVLTYIIGWDERENVTASNVTLIDTIPNGVTFVPNSVTVNGVLRPGATVTPPSGINVGTIAAFQSVTVSYRAIVNTIPAVNPIPNDYTVLFTNTLVSGLQSEISNQVDTQVNFNMLDAVTKSVDQSFATIGDTLNYTLTFNNVGNSTITRLFFVDTIPTGTIFIPNSLTINGVPRLGANPNPPGVNNLGGGTIPSGVSTITFSVSVVSLPSNRQIENIGTFSYDYIINPLIGEIGKGVVNSSSVVTTLNFANLQSPVKSVDKKFSNLPATLTYTVTITNTGITTANQVVFRDTIPEGTTFVDNSVTINGISNSGNPNSPGITLPDISPGASVTVTFRVFAVTMPDTNPVLNSSTNFYSYVVNPTTGSTVPASGNSNVVSTEFKQAQLSEIKKFVNKNFATCGDILTYTIVIPNTGNVAANNLILSDTIPSGTQFVSNSLTLNGINITGTPSSIFIGTIAAGATATITFQVKVLCI